MGDKVRKSYIRAIGDFAKFLGRSPDKTNSDDLRAYHLHMTDTGLRALDLCNLKISDINSNRILIHVD